MDLANYKPTNVLLSASLFPRQRDFFSRATTLDGYECKSTWVTIDLIDIGIQRLGRIKSGLQRDLRKAKAAIFCKLCFFCYICNAFSHAAHGLCLRDGRKQPHNEQKSQLK